MGLLKMLSCSERKAWHTSFKSGAIHLTSYRLTNWSTPRAYNRCMLPSLPGHCSTALPNWAAGQVAVLNLFCFAIAVCCLPLAVSSGEYKRAGEHQLMSLALLISQVVFTDNID